MKSMLAKALLTTVGAIAVAGVAAPAYAHVDAGGGGTLIATADEPFVAGEQHGWAETSHIAVAGQKWGWATSTAVGGGADGEAHIG
ncbi:hypothetical protein [Kitasatospora paranensis]|jgi:hypothetical protein|uniref:Uncharacterized protein n=1 Tax=Kitasatospora paranensis TaxID=258053 RepID=A0ABW2FWU1_9ACTN